MSDDVPPRLSSPPLTEAEMITLEAILEQLIPSDSNGPGSREAKVSEFIVRLLSDDDASPRLRSYRQGLRAIDDLARAAHGLTFAGLPGDHRDELLRDLEADRAQGFSPSSAAFFELVRTDAVEGMFCDPRWGGNADRVGWNLIGYAGPRPVWTEEDQRIESRPA